MFVTAGAGATGLAAVDIASNLIGATVIAAAGSEAKLEVCRQAGATHTINYNEEDIRSVPTLLVDRIYLVGT